MPPPVGDFAESHDVALGVGGKVLKKPPIFVNILFHCKFVVWMYKQNAQASETPYPLGEARPRVNCRRWFESGDPDELVILRKRDRNLQRFGYFEGEDRAHSMGAERCWGQDRKSTRLNS